MSDKDLIKRGDTEEARDELVRVLNYINSSGTLDYADYCELFNTIKRVFDALKAVPQEMSAREFLKEKARMKATLLEECKKRVQCREPSCRICQWSYRDRVPDGNFERENPQQAISIVEAWAREHPEERSEE